MTKPGNESGLQDKSWADPYRAKQVERQINGVKRQVYLVGEIYFPTDVHTLDSDDASKLDILVEGYETLLEEIDKLELFFVGHADFRYKIKYNLKLSEKRANEVSGYFAKQSSFASSDNWKYEVDPKGEEESVQPGNEYKGIKINRGNSPSVLNILKEFRKVQIYSNKNVPIRLGFECKRDYGEIYMLSLEREEIRNEGNSYAYSEEDLHVAFDAMKFETGKGIKPPDDPKQAADMQRLSKMDEKEYVRHKRSLITAIARVEYSEYQSGGKTIYRVNAVVRKKRDNKELFRANIEAEAKIGYSGVWYLSSPPENHRQVWRQAEPGKTVHDYRYAREVKGPTGLDEMIDGLYKDLKKEFANISERVKFTLAPDKETQIAQTDQN